jgi:hypothetical protein
MRPRLTESAAQKWPIRPVLRFISSDTALILRGLPARLLHRLPFGVQAAMAAER